jgi:hypothetical protein
MGKTAKYQIEGKNTRLWVWYRSGSLQKIELKKGKITPEILKSLYKLVPTDENEIEKVNALNDVTLTQLSTEKSLSWYQQYVSAWFDFYNAQVGIKPKFDGAEGKALKSIIRYLDNESTDQQEAYNTFTAMLSNWHKLDNFYRRNLDLKFINSQLNKIIINLNYVTTEATKGNNAANLRGQL